MTGQPIVRSYVFRDGTKPTPPSGSYPSTTVLGVTDRAEEQREIDGQDCWVVTWTFTPHST